MCVCVCVCVCVCDRSVEHSFPRRVIVPGSYPWQMVGDSEPPPGSAMAVSMHFLASILTQFADRRLFLYLFGHNLGTKAEAVFTAMAESLVNPEGEGDTGEKEDRKLSQSSPIKYLFQVCTKKP